MARANGDAGRELTEIRGRDRFVTLQAARDLDQLAVARTEGHLLLARLAGLDDVDGRDAREGRNRIVWRGEDVRVELRADHASREEPGLQHPIDIFDNGFDRKRAGRLIDGWAHIRDLPDELPIGKRLDDELDGLTGSDDAGVAFLNRGFQLERVHLHDRDDRRVFADELAGLHQPLGDRSRDRRPDDG